MNLVTLNLSCMIRFSLLSILMLAGCLSARAQCACSEGGSFLIHEATSANITGNFTVITHPLTDNNPNAFLLVTPKWDPLRFPPAVLSIYNHPIGVWYTGSRWAIFNQDLAAMDTHSTFNVNILNSCPATFVHRASSTNTSFHVTTLDHPLANNNPNALLYVTSNWNPGGAGGVYNNHPIGVWYTGTRWAIFNQDFVDMRAGASFNVEIKNAGPTAFVHRATASNTAGFDTAIDNPLTNNISSAVLILTPNWNPDGGIGVYFNRNYALFYTRYRWTIRTQNDAFMTTGPAFNVKLVANKRIVFDGNRDDPLGEIYIMNSDAGDRRRLTDDPSFNSDPDISPDGTRVAYHRRTGDLGIELLIVINADGTGEMSPGGGTGRHPAWSPDGTKIAYDNGADIFIIDAVAGSSPRRVTSDGATYINSEPTWSPDGTRIAFKKVSRSDMSLTSISVINIDGTGQVNITAPGTGPYDSPDWSPAGTRIVYAKGAGASAEIYVMNADGSVETRLTNNTWNDTHPAWSGDGTQIIFESWRPTAQIWTMCIDGSVQTQRTFPPGDNKNPRW